MMHVFACQFGTVNVADPGEFPHEPDLMLKLDARDGNRCSCDTFHGIDGRGTRLF